MGFALLLFRQWLGRRAHDRQPVVSARVWEWGYALAGLLFLLMGLGVLTGLLPHRIA
jgi:hypothetical protein